MEHKNFNIRERAEGPAGWVDYIEDAGSLSFFSEPEKLGFTILLGPPQDWDAHCKTISAEWAIGRRKEIVQTIIGEMKRRYKTDDVVLEEPWIVVHYKMWLDPILGILDRHL